MSDIRIRTFATLDEAQAACKEKESVFRVTDTAVPGRDVYVAARTHPLARAAAALAWGIDCTTAHTSDVPKPADVVKNVDTYTDDELEAMLKRIREAKKARTATTPS